MKRSMYKYIVVAQGFLLMAAGAAFCQDANQTSSQQPEQPAQAAQAAPLAPEQPVTRQVTIAASDPAKIVKATEEVLYTLGPDDVIEVEVQRHPEFSGTYPINLEGKIQYEYVGDIEVTGLTKKQLEEKIRGLIGRYVANPVVTVTITEYRSKVFYVIGEVGHPGKYYMRSETTTVRDAIVEAGLPQFSAAMRKARLITPDRRGRPRTKKVNLYEILYGGNLKRNLEMHSGDVLYVPSTVMAKVFRVIAPITEPVTAAAEAQTGVTTLNTRPSTTSGAGRQRMNN
jgi:polysaccharide biosynthesis/export protein